MSTFHIGQVSLSLSFRFVSSAEGFIQWVPENRFTLRSNVFLPPFNLVVWGPRWGVLKLWEATCLHACLPASPNSGHRFFVVLFFFFFTSLFFLPLCMVINTRKPSLPFRSVCFCLGRFVYSSVRLCKCQPQTGYFYLFYAAHVASPRETCSVSRFTKGPMEVFHQTKPVFRWIWMSNRLNCLHSVSCSLINIFVRLWFPPPLFF